MIFHSTAHFGCSVNFCYFAKKIFLSTDYTAQQSCKQKKIDKKIQIYHERHEEHEEKKHEG